LPVNAPGEIACAVPRISPQIAFTRITTMPANIISSDQTTQIIALTNDILIVNQNIDVAVNGDNAITGDTLSEAFIRIYGDVISFGASAISVTAFTTSAIFIGAEASLYGYASAISLEGNKNGIVNNGAIDSWGASGVSLAGAENTYTNNGFSGGFNLAVLVDGSANSIVNNGTMTVTSVDSAFPPSGNGGTVTFASETGEANRLSNFGTISGPELAIFGAGGREFIENFGVIRGNIVLGEGDDSVINSFGRIVGDIDLGGGDDQYVGGPGDFVNGVTGGGGNDTYFLKEQLTAISEDVGGGTDTVLINVSAHLAANVDNLALIGANDINGTGNVLSNQILGNGGDNRLRGMGGEGVLEGGAGADLLAGGTGLDYASYVGSEEGVAINLARNTASGGDADDDRLFSIENLFGSDLSDTLIGNLAANLLGGKGGADRIDGGKGNDFLFGDAGKDTFVFSKGSGRDEIDDFALIGASADRIDLRALTGIDTFNEAKAAMTNDGSDVVLKVGADELTILNVQKASFNTGDFIL